MKTAKEFIIDRFGQPPDRMEEKRDKDIAQLMKDYAEQACAEQRTLCRKKYVEVKNQPHMIATAIQLTETPDLK